MNFKLTDHKKYVIFSYLTIGANILTGFVLFPLILKNIGLAALGVFGLLFSTKSIIEIGIGWLSGSITKNLIKYKYIKADISTLSFMVNILYGLLSFIIIFLYGFFLKEEYLLTFIYFGLFSLISFSIVPFYEILISELKQYQTAFFRFLQQFLFMILSIGMFFIIEVKSLADIFLMLLLSVGVVFILVSLYFFKVINIKFSIKNISKKMLNKLILNDGIKYFFNGMSTILLLQIDVILIDYLYGSESAGIYLILWKIPNTIIMLGWRLSDPLQAIIAKNIKSKKEELKVKFFSFEKKMLVLSFSLALGYALLGKWVLEIWLGGENIPNLEYMYIIPAIVIAFSIMQRVYLSVNYYTQGIEIITKLQFIEIIFKIVFIFFTFKYFAELAPIIGWFFAFLFTIYFYRKNSLKVLLKCKD
jgi:O-antigen/teichoic acid export membrane protein